MRKDYYLVMNDSIYPSLNEHQYNQSMAITDFCVWILSSFEIVPQVEAILDEIFIWGNKVPVLNIVMKLHISVHDAIGNNLVIEFIDGKTKLYNNILGVLTNEPQLDFHLKNLGSYNQLSSFTSNPIVINRATINPIPGTGLDYMSGGWSPTARFIRIATLIRFLKDINTSQDGIIAASWILNSVFVPDGVEIGMFNDQKVIVTTKWSTIKDSTKLKFCIRSDDSVLRCLDLNRINFANESEHKPYTVRQPPFSIDITKLIG